MNPFDVKLFDMLPEMPQPLALAVLVCLAVLTIGHLIFRVRLVMTKGFALQHEIPTVVEMIESGKSYTDIMAFMREHERGSKDPIVSATYSMVCHALQGMDSFVGKMEECREMAKSQDHWYTRNKMFPSTIVFVVLLMTGTIACSSLPYSDMTWGLAWICAGYWGLIAAVRHFISFFGRLFETCWVTAVSR